MSRIKAVTKEHRARRNKVHVRRNRLFKPAGLSQAHTGKTETIRKRLNLSPDQIAPRVGAKSGADILAYENNEADLPVSVLWAYARLAGNPMMNLIDDDLEVNWSNN